MSTVFSLPVTHWARKHYRSTQEKHKGHYRYRGNSKAHLSYFELHPLTANLRDYLPVKLMIMGGGGGKGCAAFLTSRPWMMVCRFLPS